MRLSIQHLPIQGLTRAVLKGAVITFRCLQLLTHVSYFIAALRHRHAIEKLPDLPLAAPAPRLSIILAVRDDERTVATVVERLLQQDYPNLELVLVNDRSTDRTGEILEGYAQAHPGRVHLITIRELPKGWIGKQHAVWRAEQAATGEWLLFTDADAVLSPDCCRRAMAYLLQHGYDHLVMQARVPSPSYWVWAFAMFWMRYSNVMWGRNYQINLPNSDCGTGWGPFNLVRRSVYHAIGTHAEFGFDPSEDVRLGERVVWMGYRQHLLDGVDHFTLEWHSSLRAALRGIDKNFFEGSNYSRRRVIMGVCAVWLLVLDPWLSVWRSSKLNRLLLLSTLFTEEASFLFANRRTSLNAILALPTFPVSVLIWMYVSIHSMCSTLAQGGLYWRENFYSLEELVQSRQKHVEFGKNLREEAARKRSATTAGESQKQFSGGKGAVTDER